MFAKLVHLSRLKFNGGEVVMLAKNSNDSNTAILQDLNFLFFMDLGEACDIAEAELLQSTSYTRH